MTKILNLDALQTKRDKVIILGGKEHVMATFTVKDYIHQLKQGEKINSLLQDTTADNASQILELTLEALNKAFPTISKEQLENLSLDQLTALRELTEDVSTAEASEGLEENAEGEGQGETS